MENILEFLLVIFAFRAEYYDLREDDFGKGMAWAYDNAMDMLYYASRGEWDYLRQFGWSDEAEALLEKIDRKNLDPWNLRDIVKKEMWENEM